VVKRRELKLTKGHKYKEGHQQQQQQQQQISILFIISALLKEKVKIWETKREERKKPGNCHNCGEQGHWAYECPKPINRERGRGNRYKKESRRYKKENNKLDQQRKRYENKYRKTKAMLSKLREETRAKKTNGRRKKKPNREEAHATNVDEQQILFRESSRVEKHGYKDQSSGDESSEGAQFGKAFKSCDREAADFYIHIYHISIIITRGNGCECPQ